MARNTLFFSVCIAYMLQLGSANWINGQCGATATNKPGFYANVEKRLRRAHFARSSARPNDAGLGLNHVLSWRAIKERIIKGLKQAYAAPVDRKIRKKNEIRNFVNKLLTIDQDAYVTRFYNDQNPSQQAHSAYLRSNRADLVTKNDELKTNALATLNGIDFNAAPDCDAMRSLLKDLNNAPANLLYGRRDMLGDLLDPMGDRNGVMTRKEFQWYMQDNYFAQHGPSGFNNGYYLESSTGKEIRGHTVVPNTGRRLYWIRCYYNTPTCRP